MLTRQAECITIQTLHGHAMKGLDFQLLITPSGLPALDNNETIIDARAGVGLYLG